MKKIDLLLLKKSFRVNAKNHPQNESMGQREIFMSRELYIDQEDFREDANEKFKRLGSRSTLRDSNSDDYLEADPNQEEDK